MDILIVVDMQNDFIDGSLGSIEAQNIVENVVQKIKQFNGDVYYTKDTHQKNYLTTSEGEKLPVEHCIEHSTGWQFHPEIEQLNPQNIFTKCTFGSLDLMHHIQSIKNINSITFVGLCTDICVISNAMLIKCALPEVEIYIDKHCCAGVTLASHKNALDAMSMCQINII